MYRLKFQIPPLFESIQGTQHDWQFYAESDSACQAYVDGCYWPRGRLLGGSSSLNAMLYVRGTKRNFDRWAELGNPTWDYEHVLKYMKKSEANENPEFVKYKNGRYHSDDGPIRISRTGELRPLAKIFIDAAQEIGINYVNDINADVNLGIFHPQSFISNGRRQSAAKAFLVPAKNRTNLHIIKNAHVQKILIDDNNVVTGVEFKYKNNQVHTATVQKEVILSAGAVSSPQILMLSGVGPKNHLEQHKIEVKYDSAVGKNLLDHIMVPVYFQFHRCTAVKESPTQLLDALYNLAIHNSGPLSRTDAIQLLAMINTANRTDEPDIEPHMIFFERGSNLALQSHLKSQRMDSDIADALLQANANGELVIIWLALLQPKSVGFIELKSSSPDDKPRIVPNYFQNDEDMRTMIRAIKQQLSLTKTAAFRKHAGTFVRLPLNECNKLEYMSDEYWRCYSRFMSSTVYHPVGTSKMGTDYDRDAVVDSRLKVRGVQGLRQIDAGISKFSERKVFTVGIFLTK